jgi:hypothetical protein
VRVPDVDGQRDPVVAALEEQLLGLLEQAGADAGVAVRGEHFQPNQEWHTDQVLLNRFLFCAEKPDEQTADEFIGKSCGEQYPRVLLLMFEALGEKPAATQRGRQRVEVVDLGRPDFQIAHSAFTMICGHAVTRPIEPYSS